MPELSRFFGIIIRVRYADHAPPHFHADYGEHQASIEIASGAIIAGYLPPRTLGHVVEWTSLYREELMLAWDSAQKNEAPTRIEPLE